MIRDLHLELSKNAKCFYNEELQTYYAVHYDHVVLVVTENGNVLDLYPAGQTSCTVIRDVMRHLGFNIDILKEYNRIHESDVKRISHLYHYGYQNTGSGYYYPKRFTKKDWAERLEALENQEPKTCERLVTIF